MELILPAGKWQGPLESSKPGLCWDDVCLNMEKRTGRHSSVKYEELSSVQSLQKSWRSSSITDPKPLLWAVTRVRIQQWRAQGTPKLLRSSVISMFSFSVLWYIASYNINNIFQLIKFLYSRTIISNHHVRSQIYFMNKSLPPLPACMHNIKLNTIS